MDDIIQAFLAESRENLVQVDAELARLDKEPENPDCIASIFRRIRSLKGPCGFIGLRDLGAVAQSVEIMLGHMCSGSLAASSSTISLVIAAVDEMKRLLRRIEEGKHDGVDRHLIAELDKVAAFIKDRMAAVKRTAIPNCVALKRAPWKNPSSDHISILFPNFTEFVHPAIVATQTAVPSANRALEPMIVHALAPVVSSQHFEARDNQRPTASAGTGGINRVTAEIHDERATKLLLFDGANSRKMAVPLSRVFRLEEFPRDWIECSDDCLVAECRGALLRLLPLEGSEPGVQADPQLVIVFNECPNSFGLMVERVEDIIEERITIRARLRQPGVLGNAVINGRHREILDLQHYILRATPKSSGDATVSRIAI